MTISFKPTPDVATILNHLLDVYEHWGGAPKQAVRVNPEDIAPSLPGYYSQTVPTPRLTANEQLTQLEQHGLVRLTWQPGQTSHLLATVTLEASRVAPLYTLLERQPLTEQRQRLRDLLLGNRFQLDGWRRRAIEHCLHQLKRGIKLEQEAVVLGQIAEE